MEPVVLLISSPIVNSTILTDNLHIKQYFTHAISTIYWPQLKETDCKWSERVGCYFASSSTGFLDNGKKVLALYPTSRVQPGLQTDNKRTSTRNNLECSLTTQT
jgi:hypothetical protein